MDRTDSKRVQVLNALEALQHGQNGGQLRMGDVMTTDLSCTSPQSSVLELLCMFDAKAFRHLLIADERGQLLGIVSDRDVLHCLGPGAVDKNKLAKIVARDLMSADLLTVNSQTPVVQAIGTIIDQGISCLPIVDGERLMGIVTNTDLHVVLQTLLQTARLTGAEKPAARATL